MILALFIFGLAFAAFCGLLIYGYRSRAHSAEARANRAEGALDETKNENSFLRGLTEKAIRYAAEAAKMDADKILPRRDPNETYDVDIIKHDQVRASYSIGPNGYISPVVAYCSNCKVSVRHDPSDYPVPCPACRTLIDPVLDNPPELN